MGFLIAIIIIISWCLHLCWSLLYVEISLDQYWWVLHFFIQIHLFTGLFISAHDAIHGTVSSKTRLNNAVGWITSFLYAAMIYGRLRKKHYLHHKHAGNFEDPDYHDGNGHFFIWWFKFMLEYIHVFQIVLMAIFFNVLNIWVDQLQLIVFWVVPATLSTFQLFYFGTYLPHRTPHLESMMPHNARSQPRNHLKAFLSCYFFGYHFEHHESPSTPWWKLYQLKRPDHD